MFLTSLGLATAVLIMEAMFQMFFVTPLWNVLPMPEVSLYGPDAPTGYAHRPGTSGIWMTENRSHVTISAQGLRDRDRPAVPNGPRIVVVGNSMIEATQVAQGETAVAVAEKSLQRHTPGIEVLNLGLAGATPAVEIARLFSRGTKLRADLALVVVPLGDLLSAASRDDSGFTAYRQQVDGSYGLSYGFREGRGFRFRTSAAGDAMYAALDHSFIATLLNNRKNIGFFAEFPSRPQAPSGDARPQSTCQGANLNAQARLWLTNEPADAAGVRDAFIRDLAAFQKSGTTVIVLVQGLNPRCELNQRQKVMARIIQRFAEAGLDATDLDAEIVRRVGASNIYALHGFASSLGRGHLNVDGNKVYGAIFADVIRRSLSRMGSPAEPRT
ncbi:hypothetical protein GCM10007276_11000 [Agaricicola taiwanensis]|uniref:SGNH/GDSL hydrolase family protein n=1 Tax=Agaricicola taiwanensis TaxID=591372 RepID=A0A8J2VL00_9RHOB|nr:hypothetical protein [Agaricicola taiwanensis]GGE35295.1 hypothetical protein GCM10007276_11000 [Agaricicola taiwanensis]